MNEDDVRFVENALLQCFFFDDVLNNDMSETSIDDEKLRNALSQIDQPELLNNLFHARFEENFKSNMFKQYLDDYINKDQLDESKIFLSALFCL